MPRNYSNIQDYVEQLLDDDLVAVEPGTEHLAYGYPDERHILQDPLYPLKQVVAVEGNSLEGIGQPNALQEAYNYIDNLASAARSLVSKDNPLNKELKLKTIDKIAEKFKQEVQQNLVAAKSTGDLFSSKKSRKNKDFLRELEKARKLLSLYTETIGKTTGHSLKELETEGHQIRSQNRATLIHRFRTANGEQQFIIYLPCGRYTKRQQRLRGKEPQVNRDHDTTSHNRANLTLGNSNLARMIIGTRDANGAISIHHDSFTGPGARMPYSDFKKADSYKKLAIKAATLINQEEIIQILAQRQIDLLSDEDLWQKIPENERPEDAIPKREELIELYLAHNPLSVTECYTQVVTAGQKISAENQREQFTYVCQMMDVFDGEKASVTIQTSEENEVEVDVGYQARIGSWGVNWFRKGGTLNPLASNQVTRNQNTRFINEMTSDTIKNLQQVRERLGGYNKVDILLQLIKGPDVQEKEIAIQQINALAQMENQEHLDKFISLKAKYRETLFTYFEEYQKSEAERDEQELRILKNSVANLESQLKRLTRQIYTLNREIEAIRKDYFESNKAQIKIALSELREQIRPALLNAGTRAEVKADLQHFYNSCAYLVHAQELYYGETWHSEKNNFKLQTLAATLAVELGYANTKGCKSNNDRGQRLAQKIAGNALWTKMSEDGLYTGDFLNRARTHGLRPHDIEKLDRELMTIQALHHTANTGVSGGKFKINKKGFADNGLFGKIANLAKIKEMHYKNAITSHLKRKLAISAGLGLTFTVLIMVLAFLVPPLAPFVAATGLGLLGITGLAILTGFTIGLGIFLTSIIIGAIQNKLHNNKINRFVAEGLQNAQNELQAIEPGITNSVQLHRNLGVKEVPAHELPQEDKRPSGSVLLLEEIAKAADQLGEEEEENNTSNKSCFLC